MSAAEKLPNGGERERVMHDLVIENATLIVFPAWLLHSVQPNQSEMDRISVSFNAMLSDYAERISPPRWRPR